MKWNISNRQLDLHTRTYHWFTPICENDPQTGSTLFKWDSKTKHMQTSPQISTWTLWLKILTRFGEHFRHRSFRNAQFPLITYWIQMRPGRPLTMALSKLFKIESRCRLTSAKSNSITKTRHGIAGFWISIRWSERFSTKTVLTLCWRNSVKCVSLRCHFILNKRCQSRWYLQLQDSGVTS